MNAPNLQPGIRCEFCNMALTHFSDVWMSPRGIIACADAAGCSQRQANARAKERETQGLDPEAPACSR